MRNGGTPPPGLGSTPLSRRTARRSVDTMKKLFDSIRTARFRRGPQRLVAGICGGLAELLGLNVWLVRVLVLVSFALPVLGVGAYLIAWVVTPWRDGSIPLERAISS